MDNRKIKCPFTTQLRNSIYFDGYGSSHVLIGPHPFLWSPTFLGHLVPYPYPVVKKKQENRLHLRWHQAVSFLSYYRPWFLLPSFVHRSYSSLSSRYFQSPSILSHSNLHVFFEFLQLSTTTFLDLVGLSLDLSDFGAFWAIGFLPGDVRSELKSEVFV